MICEIIVSKTLCGIFLIFCRLSFINNFMVKNSFSEKNSAKVKYLETHLFFKTYSAMFCRFYLYKQAGRIEKIFFNHQISAKNSNVSKKKLFLCVYMQTVMQIPVKQFVLPDLFVFSSYYCFSDRSYLKIYLTMPIATSFILFFGLHFALSLPSLSNFSSIANPGSRKPFLAVRTTGKTNQQRYLG